MIKDLLLIILHFVLFFIRNELGYWLHIKMQMEFLYHPDTCIKVWPLVPWGLPADNQNLQINPQIFPPAVLWNLPKLCSIHIWRPFWMLGRPYLALQSFQKAKNSWKYPWVQDLQWDEIMDPKSADRGCTCSCIFIFLLSYSPIIVAAILLTNQLMLESPSNREPDVCSQMFLSYGCQGIFVPCSALSSQDKGYDPTNLQTTECTS